jgi:hypothetical protein
VAVLSRVNVAWQNWPGAPGSTVFYGNSTSWVQGDVDAIRTFFDAIKQYLPSGLTITVPSSGDNIDDGTGDIVGTWSVATPPIVVSGTGAGAYAGNAGAVVHWLTDDVVNGRRVRGRSFLVPLTSAAYDTGGSLIAGALTILSNAAAALVTATSLRMQVWHRPQPPAAGSSHPINGSRVPDLAVSLRSRRI